MKTKKPKMDEDDRSLLKNAAVMIGFLTLVIVCVMIVIKWL